MNYSGRHPALFTNIATVFRLCIIVSVLFRLAKWMKWSYWTKKHVSFYKTKWDYKDPDKGQQLFSELF